MTSTPDGSSNICQLDAVSLAGEISAKRLSPVEVVDAVLDRMDRLDPHIHAFCTPTPEAARADAMRIEKLLMAGEPVGPLAGVPVAIKDLVCTKGVRTVSGSKLYEDFVPDEDDVVVERLKDAGAIVIGKTNVPEFGYSGVGHNPVFPATRNPWNTDLTSGGSSAGSGAAVSAGIGPFAIGSDGGGSIRIPASFCGVYGMKASMGRVPLYPGTKDERYPGVSSWESLEHIGPLSRTVADAALMLSVIAGPDDRDRYSLPTPEFDWMDVLTGGISGCRVAYSSDWGYAAVDPEVRAVVGRAVRVFEDDLGCVVEEANPGWDNPFEAFWATVASESDLTGLRRRLEEVGADNMTPYPMDRGAVHGCAACPQGRQQQDVALYAQLRPTAHPNAGGTAVRSRHPGPRDDRGQEGRADRVVALYLSAELHRATRGKHSCWFHCRRPANRPADHRSPPG